MQEFKIGNSETEAKCEDISFISELMFTQKEKKCTVNETLGGLVTC